MLRRQADIFYVFEVIVLSVHLVLLVCLSVWCGAFLFMTFSLNDVPLIGLLLITLAAYFIANGAQPETDALTLLAGVALGKGTKALLSTERGMRCTEYALKLQTSKSEFRTILIGLAMLLAFSSWWHLDITNTFYHGPRWMGLWDNPNIYGMLMSAGLLLAIGLLAANQKSESRKQKRIGGQKSEVGGQGAVSASSRRLLQVFLLVAAGMTGVGLMFSYSRGSWLGAAIGLLYLASAYKKFKWRYVLPGILVMLVVVRFFWSATSDSAPWYVKRLDLDRPSAQHRVVAWNAALQMMRDHPFGVGWNRVTEVYKENYSPPVDGAMAITTNSYLMLGTQLGIPGLACFVTYVALCFRRSRRHSSVNDSPTAETSGGTPGELACETPALRYACRSAALSMLVAFWFDGGLFTLATASVFWILLELGTAIEPRLDTMIEPQKNTENA